MQSAPFAGVLMSFAVLPGLTPAFWHRRMMLVIGGWVVLALLLQSFTGGGLAGGLPAAVVALCQATAAGFAPFIILLLALYTLGGGIAIIGGPWGRPVGNLLLLILGTLLASLIGTIGASLLLIHPLLAANRLRREQRHLVFAFIVLVGNCGGALSPLGDPPLLVGYLRGVPFFWPAAHLWAPLLVLAVPVLALCYFVDRRLAAREPPHAPDRLRIRGRLNMALLVLLMAAIPVEGFWHPGMVRLLGGQLPGEQAAVTMLAAVITVVSELFTPRSIRAQNRFAWVPMREIVVLFFAIFATIGPVFLLLKQARLVEEPWLWFWTAGAASAVLDAAPTYLIFFQAAGGDAARLTQGTGKLLSALAAGSVFFGPVTYLGNAPNLMIRAIAVHRGVKLPGFFTYAVMMILLLTPIYLLMTLLFY